MPIKSILRDAIVRLMSKHNDKVTKRKIKKLLRKIER